MRITLALAVCLPLMGQVISITGSGSGGAAPRNPMPPPEVRAGKGSIQGTVTNSVTHQPVKKATVTLSGVTQLHAVTDEAGHFAFKQLPAGSFMLQAQASSFPQPAGPPKTPRITLAEEESKSGVDIALTPGGSVSGKLVDEEGSPIQGCQVSTVEVDSTSGVKRLNTKAAGVSDDHGVYHLLNVPTGKYYVMARCFSNIPLPHAFLRRGPDAEVPTLAYAPVVYPASTDLTGASTVSVTPGGEVSGIDFQVSPAAGATVRGHVGSADAETSRRFVQIVLLPQDATFREMGRKNAVVNRQTGTFRFEHVMPGSYQLIATSRGEDGVAVAMTNVVVGSGDPQPVEMLVERSPFVNGSLLMEDDSKQQFESMQVSLQPSDGEFYGPPSQAKVSKDGTFVLPNVTPGKWRLYVSGLNGFIKSVTIADRESSGDVIDFSRGVSGPLKITGSSKWAQVTGSVTGLTAQSSEQVGTMWPADDAQGGRGSRMFSVQPDGRFVLSNLMPGQFYVCVLASPEGWSLVRNAGVLEQLRTRCPKIEVKEGEPGTVQVPFISADDLQRIVEESNR